MKVMVPAIAAALVLMASTCVAVAQGVEAEIRTAAGKPIGTATFSGLPNGVLITVKVGEGGLPAGKHGMHLHAVGDCSDGGDGFKKSAAHVNHDGKKHGLANPEGPDMGDLPNLYVHRDGSAEAEVYTSLVWLDGPQGLKDADGAALVIHAGPDDHSSQPIGGAGARIACATVK